MEGPLNVSGMKPRTRAAARMMIWMLRRFLITTICLVLHKYLTTGHQNYVRHFLSVLIRGPAADGLPGSDSARIDVEVWRLQAYLGSNPESEPVTFEIVATPEGDRLVRSRSTI